MPSLRSHRSSLLLVFLFSCGCGTGRPEVAKVSGVVKVDGKPIGEGTITFTPPKGPVAASAIGADGGYSLTTFDPDDGAVLGDHRVTILAMRTHNAAEAATSFQDEVLQSQSNTRKPAPTLEWLVPEVYANDATSPLSREVQPGENTIDFELSSQP